jgi:hypothetical protein
MTLSVGHSVFWEKHSGFHLHGTSCYIVYSDLHNVSNVLSFVKKYSARLVDLVYAVGSMKFRKESVRPLL